MTEFEAILLITSMILVPFVYVGVAFTACRLLLRNRFAGVVITLSAIIVFVTMTLLWVTAGVKTFSRPNKTGIWPTDGILIFVGLAVLIGVTVFATKYIFEHTTAPSHMSEQPENGEYPQYPRAV